MSQINKVLLTTLRKLVSLPDVKQKLRRVLSAASECLSKVVPKAKFPADRIVCGGGGSIPGNSMWRGALFQTKNMSFSTPVFRPGVGRNYLWN